MSPLNSPPNLLDMRMFLTRDLQVIFLHQFLGFTHYHLKSFAGDPKILHEQPNRPNGVKSFIWVRHWQNNPSDLRCQVKMKTQRQATEVMVTEA